MTRSQRLSLLLCPLFLRLVLGVTFAWAGMASLFGEISVSGVTAACLANMGVSITPTGDGRLPPVGNPASPATPPARTPSRGNDGGGVPAAGPLTIAKGVLEHQAPEPADPEPLPAAKTETRKQPGSGDKANGEKGKNAGSSGGGSGGGQQGPAKAAPAPPGLASLPTSGVAVGTFNAGHFPTGVPVRKVYGLAVKIYQGAYPPAGVKNPVALLPGWLASGMVPVYLAHSVGVIELMGGLLLLVGIYSRFWAFCCCGIMVGEVWLDQIGPAIWAENTVLWLIPVGSEPGAWHNIETYRPLLWQLLLLAGSACVLLMGSGSLALDNSGLFGGAAQGKGAGKAKPAPVDDIE